MSSTKIIPLQLDDNTVIYMEVREDSTALPPVSTASESSEEVRRSGQKGFPNPATATQQQLNQSMQMVQNTIRAYTTYSLNAFKNFGAAHIEEVVLEFGINLSANGGIPYIANGQAQSSLKITVKCAYKASTSP